MSWAIPRWRIRQKGDNAWVVEEYGRLPSGATQWYVGTVEFWSVHAQFPSGAEAIAAFAAGGR